MKRGMLILLSLILITGLTACSGSNMSAQRSNQEKETTRTDIWKDTKTEADNKAENTLLLQVGEQIFTITLYDNASSQALLERLPLTLDMSEMNGNEKYYFLPEKLPSHDEDIRNINAGDLMLYGTDCLVVFYESFSTSYRYTPLGKINDPGELAQALGSGDVQVTFRAR